MIRFLLIFGLIPSLMAEAAQRPNIVYIMADDLGWADVGYQGARFYETPNIDKLRASGMAFTSAYPGASNCMPSRACLMTGMYVTRTQMWTPSGKAKGSKRAMKFLVPRRGDKEGDEVFPSKLSLDPSVVSVAEVLGSAGYRTARLGKWHLGPDTQGFHLNDPDGKGGPPNKRYYGNVDVAESLTDAAVSFIGRHKEGAPFFLYLCHWDVHTPIRARRAVVEKYKRKLASKAWDKPWNPAYAAMIEAVDTSVGRVWQALKESGLDDETLLIFTSDNGGYSGATWCHPLKGAKGAFYEGGIRVPFCASWPGVIEPGSTCATPITGVDFMPTAAALAGAELPQAQPVDGESHLPLLKGESTPEARAIFWHYPLYLSGAHYNKVVPIHGTEKMYWRATPCSVIRKGDWKLIQFFEDDSAELYHLGKDLGESHDLAQREPEKTAALLADLKAWQRKTKAVIPSELNPDFHPDEVVTEPR